MKISVIMSVYDESIDQLQKSIDSILHQSFKYFEFIIVLDKPSNIEARKYILDQKTQDKRIIFLENHENIKL
jgi:glycosyltransferase involved in cell wall biosynthesis